MAATVTERIRAGLDTRPSTDNRSREAKVKVVGLLAESVAYAATLAAALAKAIEGVDRSDTTPDDQDKGFTTALATAAFHALAGLDVLGLDPFETVAEKADGLVETIKNRGDDIATLLASLFKDEEVTD